jgi:hypothetical protein
VSRLCGSTADAAFQGQLGWPLKRWLTKRLRRDGPEAKVRRLLNCIDELQSGLADIVGRV